MNEADLLVALHAELDDLAQRLAAGRDVSPTRRARVEGMMIAALNLGVDRQILLESCRPHLPANAHLELQPVRLDLWQRRAPVEPSA